MEVKSNKSYIFGESKVKVNDEQYKIISEKLDANMRIIACAGSGKSTSMVCRVKYLLDHKISPERIMLTTFNVDAAESLRVKIKQLLGYMPNILIGTMDSIAFRFYNAFFSKNYYVGVSEYAIEFLNYLKTNDGIQNIIKKFDYLFFDEFQDCNHIQFDIIKLFYENGCKITVIGDDAQNIYQWRGSNIDFILNLNKYIPNVITHKLVNNYRSTPEIINFANCSIKNNTDQIPKEMISNINSIGFKPIVKKYSNEKNQAIEVIKEIKAYIAEKNIKAENIAVLSRNNYSLKILEENIEKNNLTNVHKLQYVALITDSSADIKPKICDNHITLTTIHKSKGLEWDVVFLLSCNDDAFPSNIDTIGIQEERRLFYVAITRPRKHLHIYFTKKTVSRFIGEIPKILYNPINLKDSHFDYSDSRKVSYKTGITELIDLLEVSHIETLRKQGILPEFNPTTVKIHNSFKYDQIINKYYLHADFGIFIDRFISRQIGELWHNSGGLRDRTAEKIISAIPVKIDLFSVYTKYSHNFASKLNKIDRNMTSYDYFDIINIDKNDPKYLKEVEDKDYNKIVSLVEKIKDQAIRLGLENNEIMIIPDNYLPIEFEGKIKLAYSKFKNAKIKTSDIINDIYLISLCENVSNGRRRLLYKNEIFTFFTKNKEIFINIYLYLKSKLNHDLICKRFLYDRERDITGELDLLDITSKTLIDFKCSASHACKLEWIIQLLAYAALLKNNYYDVEVDNIEIYNPILGTVTSFSIKDMKDNGELLLDFLDNIRNESLNK
jgi:hypothetical protein